MGFKRKRGLIIIIVAAMLLELISAIQYYHSRNILAQELEIHAETELTLKTLITKEAIDISEQIIQSHIRDMKRDLGSPDSMFKVAEWIVKTYPNLAGCGIAFIPNYYPQKGRLFEPYALRTDSGIQLKQVAGRTHDYTKQGFYKAVIDSQRACWVGPYYDTIVKNKVISYALPIYDQQQIIAVFGLDISTELLGNTLNLRHIYPSSFDLLLTENGEKIVGPTDAKHKQSIKNVIHIINDSTISKTNSQSGNSRIAEFRDQDNGDLGYVFFSNFKEFPHWQVAVVCYDKEVYGPLRQMRLYMLLMLMAGCSVLGFIIWRFSTNDLRLQKSQLEQERINSELGVARDIQTAMLPEIYPPFPERNDVDIYGSLIAAREVGGDLFDFFIRDEKLFFCIGDVSGKGVPAAMVMAVTHSLFRSTSTHENNPSHIMQTLNESICQNNESSMFVTLFIGILNLPTGRLRYCNAGHDKPLIIKRQETQVQNLEAKAHLPLGVFVDVKYETEEYLLTANSTLFLYTDGLTEAKNICRQQFGLQRTQEQLLTLTTSPHTADICSLIKNMEKTVQQFTIGTEQSDDLTMLAIHYTPKNHKCILTEELTITNNICQITMMNQFVKSMLERINTSSAIAKQLRLAIEEAVVNIINYAYPSDTEGDIMLKIMYDGHCIQVVITDSGFPFDPTEAVKAETTLSAEDRPIGGLGILLVRELIDSINYERVDGHNILTLTKYNII